MTREEEIKQTAIEYARKIKTNVFDFAEGVRWADEHPQSPWISVEDRLPEYNKGVIGIFKDGDICLCTCSPEERIWFIGMIVCDEPVYWMPIPELPKGE